MSFVGGKLKLKGGVDPTQLKGGVKKKKKKTSATGNELAVADGDNKAAAGGGEQAAADTQANKDGVPLDPNAVADRRTEAEKKAEAHFLKYEEQRAKKAAAKSHRERIKELNEKLATLTEHHDLFNVSYTH